MASWNATTWTDAGQLLGLIDPDIDTTDAEGQSLPDWYGKLVAQGDLKGAARFIAHALPRYECIVWAVQCLLEAGAIDRSDPTVIAVLRWVDDPSDGPRHTAGKMAEQIRNVTAQRLLAEAVFYSGGSIAPPEFPAVQPAPDTCAKASHGAILFGSFAVADADAFLRQALALGEKMLSGQR